MKKLKHSKYKNTGILFEMLVRKLTSETLTSNKSVTIDIIKKTITTIEIASMALPTSIPPGVGIPAGVINKTGALIKKFKDPISAKLDWKAKNIIEINDLEQAQKLLKMIDLLEDCDDVQMVTGNYIFSADINKKL